MDACCNKREKLARRQGHPCLRFVHDFVSGVFKARNSCGWRYFITKRTIYCNAASSRSKFVGFETAEICFDLYSIISGESSACSTKVFNLFTLVLPLYMNTTVYCIPFLRFQHQCERKRANTVYLPLKPRGFPLCLVAFWSSWRDCCIIFSFSRCAPFWRRNREVYPFLAELYPFLAKPHNENTGYVRKCKRSEVYVLTIEQNQKVWVKDLKKGEEGDR